MRIYCSHFWFWTNIIPELFRFGLRRLKGRAGRVTFCRLLSARDRWRVSLFIFFPFRGGTIIRRSETNFSYVVKTLRHISEFQSCSGLYTDVL